MIHEESEYVETHVFGKCDFWKMCFPENILWENWLCEKLKHSVLYHILRSQERQAAAMLQVERIEVLQHAAISVYNGTGIAASRCPCVCLLYTSDAADE